jgi:hypothetical protein
VVHYSLANWANSQQIENQLTLNQRNIIAFDDYYTELDSKLRRELPHALLDSMPRTEITPIHLGYCDLRGASRDVGCRF